MAQRTPIEPDLLQPSGAGRPLSLGDPGAADALPNQFHKAITELAGDSSWHQLFFDQTLGANVGGQFNDLALELASGELTGAEAAEMLEEAAADER